MAISVPVPKDLNGIKTKVALNLTKRQIICFSAAAVTGIPVYFCLKKLIGTQTAAFPIPISQEKKENAWQMTKGNFPGKEANGPLQPRKPFPLRKCIRMGSAW